MEYIYILVCDGAEWEDLVVYTDKDEAIAASVKNKRSRVEVFYKSAKGGYLPSYNYYKEGNYVQTK